MSDCQNCHYHKTNGGKYVFGIGNIKAELLIVGEYPSNDDARSGQPFTGRNSNGQGDADILDQLLKEIGLKRSDVFTTHLIECRPPLDAKGIPLKIEEPCVTSCHPNLDNEISYVKPKVIIALGAGTAKRLAGAKTLSSVQGRVIDSADCIGFTYAASGEVKKVSKKGVKSEIHLNKPDVFKVVPTFSLSMVRRDPTTMDTLRRAFQKANEILTGKKAEELTYDYKYAHTEESVFKLLTEVKERCATEPRLFFDIETSGLNWYPVRVHDHVSKLLCCSFGFKEREIYGVMMREKQRSFRNLVLFQQIVESPIAKSGHNGKFDNVFLRGEFGWRVNNYDFDTMLAAHILNQGGLVGLDVVAQVIRPDLGYYWEGMKKHLHYIYGYLNAPDDELLTYNCRDVDATITAFNTYEPQLKARGKWDLFTQITMPHSLETEEMEFFGMKVDVEATENLGRKKLKEVKTIQARIHELTQTRPEGSSKSDLEEFNPGSTDQVAKLLYGKLGEPCLKLTDGKGQSTDDDALQPYVKKYEWVKALLEYRAVKKQLSTYIGWGVRKDGTEGVITDKKKNGSILWCVDKNHRVHTSILIHGTATGRTSSKAPNMQNQPKTKEFRSLFIAEEGFVLGDADYGSLELRILGLVSKDFMLIQTFRDKVDLHSATGANIFNMPLSDFEGFDYFPDPGNRLVFEHFDKLGDAKDPKPGTLKAKYPEATPDQIFVRKNRKERKIGKTINFGVVYGMGASSLAEDLEITKKEAQGYLDAWAVSYSGASSWMKKCVVETRRTGKVSYSMGRERPLPEINSDNFGLKSGAERQCVNTTCQGTGADCTSTALVRIGPRLRNELGSENARIVCEIHDQGIFEIRKGYEEKVRNIVLEEMERQMPFLGDEIPLVAEYDEVMNLGQNLE